MRPACSLLHHVERGLGLVVVERVFERLEAFNACVQQVLGADHGSGGSVEFGLERVVGSFR